MSRPRQTNGVQIDDQKSLSHSVWDCKYHLVFIPKYRRKLIYGESMVRELASRSRSKNQIQGRIEFATLAISRYEYRVCDVANLIHKHRSSITLWLNKGRFNENKNPEFACRLDQLDEQTSRSR